MMIMLKKKMTRNVLSHRMRINCFFCSKGMQRIVSENVKVNKMVEVYTK